LKNVVKSVDSRWGDRKFGILVVDDEEAVRDVLIFGLRKKGFRVWQASDGRGALKTYWRYRERIDLVLLDVRMPGMDGPQTLIKLRRLTTRVHCCFMSGDLGQYAEQTLLDLGAVGIFRKPLFTIELAEKLMEIVTSPELNPPYGEARRQTIRQGPPCPASGCSVWTVSSADIFSRSRASP
jgi:two-component system, OmpR family, response regulator